MFAVIYRFQTKPNQESAFIDSWKGLTALIYQFEGSLGSRLHQESENIFIAYAQWPDKMSWQNSGNRLPEEANEYRFKMRESCEKIETLHELQLLEDMLKNEVRS